MFCSKLACWATTSPASEAPVSRGDPHQPTFDVTSARSGSDLETTTIRAGARPPVRCNELSPATASHTSKSAEAAPPLLRALRARGLQAPAGVPCAARQSAGTQAGRSRGAGAALRVPLSATRSRGRGSGETRSRGGAEPRGGAAERAPARQAHLRHRADAGAAPAAFDPALDPVAHLRAARLALLVPRARGAARVCRRASVAALGALRCRPQAVCSRAWHALRWLSA